MPASPSEARAPEPIVSEPILCLVVDRSAVRGDPAQCVAAAVAAGVDWVQIRERRLEGAALLAYAEQIDRAARQAAARRGGRVQIYVNRRIDIALALAADGVQLGFDALDPKTARRLLAIAAPLESDRAVGSRLAICISTHHPDEIRAAPPEADYAQLAPIAQPLSKPHAGPLLGVRAVAEAARYGIPVIAQGGITSDNARAIAAAGAAGIAVTGAILAAADPGRATRALRAALAAAPRKRPSGASRAGG
jgi:thiamine-phosphate pyrophosphorylase